MLTVAGGHGGPDPSFDDEDIWPKLFEGAAVQAFSQPGRNTMI